MFIPISDDNPLKHLPFQYITVGLVAANVAVFVFFQSGIFIDAMEATAVSFGMIPAVVLEGASMPPGYATVPGTLTLITYQFVHGGWLHLIGNMAFLWVFGDNVEDAMGHMRFLVFYLLCGVAAALAHGMLDPQSTIPLVGASGSVAGIIAAYLMLHPRVKVWVLVLWRLPLRLTAMWVLGFWVAIQFVMVLVPVDDGVAWWAHIGGLAAGAFLIAFMRRPGVPLFDRGLVVTPPPGRKRPWG
jgi:membrane associated rhomboid family serine protease